MKKENRTVVKAFTIVSLAGITMLTPIFMCGWFGLWLNGKFQTQVWFIVMLVLGILAGFRNLFQLFKGFFEKGLEKEQEEYEYFEQMKREREEKKKERDEKNRKPS